MRTVENVAGWPDRRVDRLKELYAQKGTDELSCAAIGRELTWEFPDLPALSRNAIIGKVSRLGLPQRGRRAPPRTGGGMPRLVRPPKAKPLTASGIAAKLAEELPPTDDPFSPKGCRWPIGEPGTPDFRFCQRPRGKRADGCESSWCEGHHALGRQAGSAIIPRNARVA